MVVVKRPSGARWLVCLAVIGVIAPLAYGRWCPDYHPDALFCDDFDRYCQNPPADDAACSAGSSTNEGALRGVWTRTSQGTTGPCGSTLGVENDLRYLSSPPFGGRSVNGGDEGNHLGQETVDLLGRIQDRLGPTFDQINGTDAEPLVLEFMMSGGVFAAFHAQYDTGYMELAYNNARAPTDYILVGWGESPECTSCFGLCQNKGIQNSGVHVPWPTICQSYTARTDAPRCPSAQTNTREALAIGMNAMLDNDPCHCDSPADQVPVNYRLSYYDGWKWGILSSSNVAGYPGTFVLGSKNNFVTLVVKTSTFDVWHRTRNEDNSGWIESYRTGIPRLQTGGFNKLRAGAGVGCELNNGAYSCAGNNKCIRMGESRCDGGGWQPNKSGFVIFDNVALHGGQGLGREGACCKIDGTCVEVLGDDCQALGGRFSSSGTTCGQVLCCPTPYGDDDKDGDVDQYDFAALQRCITGSQTGVAADCLCFDKNADNRVDATDVELFVNCATGPNVTVEPVPAGCLP